MWPNYRKNFFSAISVTRKRSARDESASKMIGLAHPHWALLVVLKSCRPNPASRSCLIKLTSTGQKPFHLTAAHFTLEAPSHLGTDAPSFLQASDIELAA